MSGDNICINTGAIPVGSSDAKINKIVQTVFPYFKLTFFPTMPASHDRQLGVTLVRLVASVFKGIPTPALGRSSLNRANLVD